MNTVLAVSLMVLTIAGVSTGQQTAPMNVSVDYEGAADATKQEMQKYVANGFASRGIHKLNDNGLDPKDPIFDDYGWIVVKSVGDPASPYAVEVQLSIAQGASANYMLIRFRGSLTTAVSATPGTTIQERDAALNRLLLSVLDRLMDEAERDFGSPAYRHGWHPRNG
jgi:hypothetical protein